MNKLCALLLSLILVATCFVFLPAEISATEPNPSGTCGENITWVLDSDGTLTISGEGHMVIDYGSDGPPWYKVMDDIKLVVIEEGITSIGYGAFQDCSNLTGITLPDSVTNIIDFAFQGCTGLTSITIPDSVTKIGESAFYGCSSLTYIAIPDSVSEIGYSAFAGCSSITSITVDSANTVYHSNGNCLIETVSKTLHAGFPSSVIPTDGSVTRIGNGAFQGCTGLTDLTIPETITAIGDDAFSNCTDLVSITIPGNVSKIGESAFWNCSSLADINIPDSVKKLPDFTFYGCTSLTSVTLPKSITKIGYGAFQNCDSLWHVLYKGTEQQWKSVEISKKSNASLVSATIHYNAVGSEVDSVNKMCTICTPPPTEPTEVTNPTEPTSTTAPTQPEATTAPAEPAPTEPAPTVPTTGSEPSTDPTVWIVVAVAVLIVGATISIILKKKH